MKRIFISYSAKKEGARQFVRDVAAAIDAASDEQGKPLFTALVDTKLREGFWRPVLYNWMVLCDAAVIVIDSDSPESVWLPREAMVFRVRKEMNRDFPIVPVLRGVTKEIFQTRAFADLGLNDLQYSEEATAETIVDKLKTMVPGFSAPKAVGRLAKLLKWPPDDPTRFDEARQLLDFEERTWFTTFSGEQEIAERLVGYGFRRGPFTAGGRPFPGARAIAALMLTMPEGNSRKIFDVLSPYWVDPSAGARLYRSLWGGTGVTALRMKLADQTGWPKQFWSCYLQHASSDRTNPPQNVELPLDDRGMGTAQDPLEESRQRVYGALWREALGRRGEPNATTDRKTIRDLCRDLPQEHVLWVHPDAQILPEHLIAIQNELPGLRIVLLCLDDRLKEMGQVHYIDCEEDTESSAFAELNAARALLRVRD